jgi:hypothetical protein
MKNKFKNLRIGSLVLLSAALLATSCKKDEETPEEEHDHEMITYVKLIFTDGDGGTVEAVAEDPDGEGAQEIAVQGPINLDTSKTYTLTFEILNAEEDPAEDIGHEIEEHGDEHQIFYSFTDNAFASPTGDGNVDNASDPVNYVDMDEDNRPVGLETTWTTPSTVLTGGYFTVRLQHQEDQKSDNSTADTGETDFEIDFVLNIQ